MTTKREIINARNIGLSDIPKEIFLERIKQDDQDTYCCPCVFYQGYKLPVNEWCEWCLGVDPEMDQLKIQCANCKQEFIRGRYKGDNPICMDCRNDEYRMKKLKKRRNRRVLYKKKLI